MSNINKHPKFPRFMSELAFKGLTVKDFAELLQQRGYKEYNYNLVRRKLRGDSSLDYEDIIIFSEVLGVEESIFFNLEYTKRKPGNESYCI